LNFPSKDFGSIVCAIQPFDLYGNKKIQRYLVKLYHDEEKARQEYKNYQNYVNGSIPAEHHPKYDHHRTYRGKAFSIFVMDLKEGPGGRPVSLREVMTSSEFNRGDVRQFVLKAIRVLDDYWMSATSSGRTDLIWEYMRKCFFGKNKESCERLLLSFDSCHRWFGSLSEGSTFEERLRLFLADNSSFNTTLKKCHGDLHTDNIMVGHYERNLYLSLLIF
jgi:hypothetical protein